MGRMMSVCTRTRGYSSRYAPSTPLIAPDAPTIGTTEWGLMSGCDAVAHQSPFGRADGGRVGRDQRGAGSVSAALSARAGAHAHHPPHLHHDGGAAGLGDARLLGGAAADQRT